MWMKLTAVTFKWKQRPKNDSTSLFVVTQHSSPLLLFWGKAMRDDPSKGCVMTTTSGYYLDISGIYNMINIHTKNGCSNSSNFVSFSWIRTSLMYRLSSSACSRPHLASSMLIFVSSSAFFVGDRSWPLPFKNCLLSRSITSTGFFRSYTALVNR